MPESANIIGARVRQAREQHTPPLTQDQLSARLARKGIEIDRAAISKIENGSRRVHDFEVVGLAQVLNTSIDWLLKG